MSAAEDTELVAAVIRRMEAAGVAVVGVAGIDFADGTAAVEVALPEADAVPAPDGSVAPEPRPAPQTLDLESCVAPAGPVPKPSPATQDLTPAIEQVYLDHNDPTDLRRAYENHDSIKQAADRFDVTYPTVFQRMVDHGIHLPNKDWDADDPEDLERVFRYENGRITATAKHFDLGKTSIRRRLIDAGLYEADSYRTYGSDITGKAADVTAGTADERGEESAETDGGAVPAGVLDLRPHDLAVADVADALVGAPSVARFASRLGVKSQDAREIAGRLRMLPKLAAGGGPPTADDVQEAIAATDIEVPAGAESSPTADGGGGVEG